MIYTLDALDGRSWPPGGHAATSICRPPAVRTAAKPPGTSAKNTRAGAGKACHAPAQEQACKSDPFILPESISTCLACGSAQIHTWHGTQRRPSTLAVPGGHAAHVPLVAKTSLLSSL
eukprot:366432-Chlamydomonas_euryale.AAC.19